LQDIYLISDGHKVNFLGVVSLVGTEVIDKIIDVLEQETAIYESILKISESKTNIIVEGKIAALENIIKLEQSLILKMRELEDKREELVSRLSEELNVDSSELTISEVSKHLQDEKASELKLKQEKMIGVLGSLKSSNELNSRLIKNSLDYIDFSINLLTAIDSGNNSYSDSGKIGSSKNRNIVDMKL